MPQSRFPSDKLFFSHSVQLTGCWPVKGNKICACWGFKAISDERARGNSRYSVKFGPMKLIFGSVERGGQGLSTEPIFSFIGPKLAFLEPQKTRLRIKMHPNAEGQQIIATTYCPTRFFGLRLDETGP